MVNTEDVGVGVGLDSYAKVLAGDYSFMKTSPKKKPSRKSKSKDKRLTALGEGTKFLYS
jgi:hypothetical protein